MHLTDLLADRLTLVQTLLREIADRLVAPLAAAAERLTQTVLDGRRCWIVAARDQRHLARHFLDRLWRNPDRPRPPFAALTLPAPCPGQPQPLELLLAEGDALLVLLGDPADPHPKQALQTALHLGITCIAIGHDPDEHTWSQLTSNDIALMLPELPVAVRDELSLLILNALLEAWENLLLGEHP
ncbi:MAG: hypothetical protein N2557_00565 [Hydrogenophilus sp.]|nr:hypothetical protein [Hydrogenophilus sp.]